MISAPATSAIANAIELRDVSVLLNGVQALESVTFSVPAGALFGLIGPNGAGKTTVMNVISGVVTPQSGEVSLHGEHHDGWRLSAAARKGIIRSFQQVRLLEELSVLENVLVGRERFQRTGLLSQVVGMPRSRQDKRADLERANMVLDVLGLTAHTRRIVRDLPFGVRRLVDVGRAFAAEPKLLLLDEPAAGLDGPSRVSLLEAIAEGQRQFGSTVVLVEHDVDLVRRACEYSVVLTGGRVLASGLTEENLRHPEVLRAYFGSEHA